MSRNRQRKSNNVMYRILKKMLLLAAIIMIPALLFMYSFRIDKVEIVGAEQYTQEQIKEVLFQTKPDHYSAYLYVKNHFFKQPRLPLVEKIDVKLVDSHTITVYVYEKMMAGCVEFMGEYLYFDKDGIVVESTSQRLKNVPVFKGLKFNEIVLNEKLKLKEQKEELFDVILNLTQLIEKYEIDVDTVSFNSGYEVTIESAGNTILLGKKSTYDEPLAELKNILLEAEGMKLRIDMRNYVKGTDSIIAKPKNSTE